MPVKINRSPRAPSLDLDEAVRMALKLYEKEGKHFVPSELAVRHWGYSGMNNGSAIRALAAMRSYGLVESKNNREVAASKDIEIYAFAPDANLKQQLLVKWLKAPKVFADLLKEYEDRLPSDQALRFKLIQNGFGPSAAEETAKNFRISVDFADYYAQANRPSQNEVTESAEASAEDEQLLGGASEPRPSSAPRNASIEFDRIPVRLSGGRRAAIEVPTPLFAADKAVLKRQIDLLFTDDEGSEQT